MNLATLPGPIGSLFRTRPQCYQAVFGGLVRVETYGGHDVSGQPRDAIGRFARLTTSAEPLHTGSRDEVDATVRAGGLEVFRGVPDPAVGRAFAAGRDYVGQGDYGDGRYFSTHIDHARGYAGEGGVVVRAALKPGAKVVTAEELARLERELIDAGTIPPTLDSGAVARGLGFDAVRSHHPYHNVVRPEALHVQRDVLEDPAAEEPETYATVFGGLVRVERYATAPPVETYADAGRWITIGGQRGDDGKRHGGTPVFVKDGRITKGAPSLTGKRIGALGDDEGPTAHQRAAESEHNAREAADRGEHGEAARHRAEAKRHRDKAAGERRGEARRSGEYEVAVLRKKARKAGHDPKHLDRLAGELKAHHDALAAERKELVRFARQFSEDSGYGDLRKRGKDRLVGGREDTQRGFDETAEATAARFPHHFGAEDARSGGSHEDQLREILSHEDPAPLPVGDAYEQALAILEEAGPSRRPVAAAPDDEKIPF